jgi:hypothetical protein
MNHTHPSDLITGEQRERAGHKAIGEQLLTTEELAVFLGVSSQVLKINRMRGEVYCAPWSASTSRPRPGIREPTVTIVCAPCGRRDATA